MRFIIELEKGKVTCEIGKVLTILHTLGIHQSRKHKAMAHALDVYLHNDLVGHLVQDDDGDTTFHYSERWLETPGAIPLSRSLPNRASAK